MDDQVEKTATVTAAVDKSSAKGDAAKKSPPREIPGNFPYTTSPGVFSKILQKIIEAERPSKFSGDFLNTVLGFSGGSALVVPPILKRTGFLNADTTPTELYNQFKSEGGRSQAAFEALKIGYSELFKRNEYAHKLEDAGLRDLLVTITGLNKGDPVIRAIAGTFSAFKYYIDPAKLSIGVKKANEPQVEDNAEEEAGFESSSQKSKNNSLGLIYNINLVIPNTDDPNVLNAIFRSLRENLLR